MKKLLFIALLFCYMNAYSTGKSKDPEPETTIKLTQEVESNSESNSESSSSVGDVLLNHSPNSSMNMENIIQGDNNFNTPEHAKNCIGSTCKSINTAYIRVRKSDNEFYNDRSIEAGVLIPFDFGGSARTTNSALGVELQKLKDENLHTREKHQSDMMVVCLELHKLGFVHEQGPPELWNRCSMYEHHNPKDPSHNGFNNARQVSPHNHE